MKTYIISALCIVVLFLSIPAFAQESSSSEGDPLAEFLEDLQALDVKFACDVEHGGVTVECSCTGACDTYDTETEAGRDKIRAECTGKNGAPETCLDPEPTPTPTPKPKRKRVRKRGSLDEFAEFLTSIF